MLLVARSSERGRVVIFGASMFSPVQDTDLMLSILTSPRVR